ncbi:hypothetical protein VCHA50O413_80194 [Vibrio chagasii]|nr:hypothetical protein VCHA28O22_100012 [Vibrio chagasii]CAH6798250.1 hypothetical protein VCHA34O109_100012 [Vibrio chagasii]CAH6853647.1 hypothetical protein VCHA34P114_240005 [Vibrio chagasii]CAH6875094.1 hypothetical protein VCHA36P168_260012 [Vibrio chagasii]CAH6876761.1 hypothetical protein VCHA31O71_260013 [Vibrio chagasii]
MTSDFGFAVDVEVEELPLDEPLQPATARVSNAKNIGFIIFTNLIEWVLSDLFLLFVATVSFSEMKECKSA